MTSIAWFFSDWSLNAYRQENDLYGAIAYYRVIKPAQVLRKWFDIDVIGAKFLKWGVKGGDIAMKYQRLAPYDLIISKHATDAQHASCLLATADYYKKKLIVDIDDNYFAIRANNPAGESYAKGQEGRYNVGAFMELASGLTVSTEPLKKTYKKLNKKIDIFPNCNDINDWPNVRKMWDDGIVRIGYPGARGHLDDLDLILEPMSYILAKYPKVYWEIIGSITPLEAMQMANKMNAFCKKDISSQIRISGGTMAWQGYPELLASCGWDIIIAPLIDDDFNRSKSHIKWMEAAMVYCPVVASPVYPYWHDIDGVKTIQDGITGFLAGSSEMWYEKLDYLICNPVERRIIGQNAYTYVKDNWQWHQWAEKYKKIIEKYL